MVVALLWSLTLSRWKNAELFSHYEIKLFSFLGKATVIGNHRNPLQERKDMAKKITGYIKLQLPAGEATPAPPVGPALGQHGVNIMEFVKQFNAKSVTAVEKGTILPVVITVYADRSFSFILKTPPAAVLIKKKIGLNKGSATPNKIKVGKITKSQLLEIAQVKMPDLNAASLDAAMRSIAGSARSMGIEIID